MRKAIRIWKAYVKPARDIYLLFRVENNLPAQGCNAGTIFDGIEVIIIRIADGYEVLLRDVVVAEGEIETAVKLYLWWLVMNLRGCVFISLGIP